MTTRAVPIVERRPSFLDDQEGEGTIVSCVDYLISLLISHAPAELISEYPPEGKPVEWIVRSLPEKNVCLVENSRSVLYRPFLARIASHFMDGSVGEGSAYGGFTRLLLNSGGRKYSAALYLGNDGLCGFWFKGMCVPLEEKDVSNTNKKYE